MAAQRLNNNELEEQCIHHFNLIKYWFEGKVRLNGQRYPIRPKSRFLQSVINKELHVIFGPSLVFKNMKRLSSLHFGNIFKFLKTNLGYLSLAVTSTNCFM